MIDTKRRTTCYRNPYDDVLEEFETARWPERGKPVQNNTRIFRRGPHTLAVQLHSTDVVTFERMDDNLTAVTLDSGGWRTVTTKARMNDWAPGIYVQQKNWEWYVRFPDGKTFFFENGFTYLAKS